MTIDLDASDFALDEMPGDVLHDVLRAHREQGPVTPAKFMGLPAFAITRHAALLEAFRDNERFPPHRMYEVSLEGAIGKSFISMADLDQHRIYRKLATPAFRSRAVASYEAESLEALAHEVADRFEGHDEVDLLAEFIASFPYLVITRLLGLPHDREEAFHRWALALLSMRDDPAAAVKASEELTEFLAPVVEERRREPRNDVISELVQAEAEGRRLTNEEVFSHIRLLFPTGGETTHGSLGNLVSAVLTRPGMWQELRGNPSRVPDAVDEILRFETPIAVLPRMSAEYDVEFMGVDIPANTWVMFAIAGANRDPAVFADPDRFDLDRESKDLLTFGRGVKSCPGMHLARRNMTVGLTALLERVANPELLDLEAAVPRRTVLRVPDALRIRRRTA